jgi:hypothetical protein
VSELGKIFSSSLGGETGNQLTQPNHKEKKIRREALYSVEPEAEKATSLGAGMIILA